VGGAGGGGGETNAIAGTGEGTGDGDMLPPSSILAAELSEFSEGASDMARASPVILLRFMLLVAGFFSP
jgi:hypothetical protein